MFAIAYLLTGLPITEVFLLWSLFLYFLGELRNVVNGIDPNMKVVDVASFLGSYLTLTMVVSVGIILEVKAGDKADLHGMNLFVDILSL